MKDVFILGIESSCDETSASIIRNGIDEISTVILPSSLISGIRMISLSKEGI